MPLYEGETLKEAIQKAVRGEKTPDPQAVRLCKGIANDLAAAEQIVSSHEALANTLDRQVQALNAEQRRLFVHLIVDLAIVAIPVAKILRVRRLIALLRVEVQAARAGNFSIRVEEIIDMIINVVGIYDAIANIDRSLELPGEIRDIRQRAEVAARDLRQAESRLQSIQRTYDQNRCDLYLSGDHLV